MDGIAIYIDFNSYSNRNEANFIVKLKNGKTLTAPGN